MSCLYILEINPSSATLFANIFSQSVGCCSVLFMVSFAVCTGFFREFSSACYPSWATTGIGKHFRSSIVKEKMWRQWGLFFFFFFFKMEAGLYADGNCPLERRC